MTNVDKFFHSYNGKELLKKYTLSDIGVWCVKGEDPNCDLGGPHYQPILGYFTGSLASVIDEAVELPGFWQWGYGGDISAVEIKQSNPDTSKRRKELQYQITELNKKLSDAKSQLEKL